MSRAVACILPTLSSIAEIRDSQLKPQECLETRMVFISSRFRSIGDGNCPGINRQNDSKFFAENYLSLEQFPDRCTWILTFKCVKGLAPCYHFQSFMTVTLDTRIILISHPTSSLQGSTLFYTTRSYQ